MIFVFSCHGFLSESEYFKIKYPPFQGGSCQFSVLLAVSPFFLISVNFSDTKITLTFKITCLIHNIGYFKFALIGKNSCL